MAVFVQKVWNDVPCIVTEGVAVEFSKNGSTIYVVNAGGHRMAMFKAGFVEKYWIEDILSISRNRGGSSQKVPSLLHVLAAVSQASLIHLPRIKRSSEAKFP
jgi:hypothetical protein